MPEADLDISQLTEEQQLALQQFTSVTDQPLDAAVPLLRRCQWNVQIAIARFFDGEPEPIAETVADGPPSRSSHHQETLLNGSSSFPTSRPSRNLEPAHRIVPQPDTVSQRPSLILSLIFLPVNILYNVTSRAFGVFLRIFPFLPRLLSRFSPGGGSTSRQASARRPLNTRDTAARFIREFEEEYGSDELPFIENGYAQAYDTANKQLKFLLVILLSPEHDDTNTFVRQTLCSSEVVNFIKEPQNNMILWGGNVQDSEAYKIATDLNVTKFPFAGLIVHTPSAATSMSLVARVPGPTPASTLVTKLQQAITQHSPALERTRATRAEQQASRNIRQEQDSAYERSLAQDRERARQKREAEAARERAEREAREKEEVREQYDRNVAQWKRWRIQSLREEPGSEVKDAVRVSVRLPSGERAVRRFRPDAPLEDLYALVECYDLLQSDAEKVEPASKPEAFEPQYKFQLVSPMPRQAYDLASGGTLGERIGRSGNLIVEQLDEDDVG